MMVQDIEKYMDYCRLFIGEKCAVTDEEIDEALNQFANMFTHIDKLEVKKRLMSLYTLPIAPYKTILDNNNPGAGWFSNNNYARKNEIEWSFWNRYQRFLRDKEKYQPGVIFQLDKLTDEILDNLYDPALVDINFSKKGLVVGQVQSGKTSNFTGLICKAVDAGFNVVIVFAGILDDLRTQTQSRLEKCFLGFTTKDIRRIQDSERIGIGVGLIDNKPIAHAFTTVVSDFKESTVNSLGANFQTKEPILFVVKKNGRILANLKKWLSKKDLDGKSVLFIDDEADNASVNTSKDKNKASSINNKIREILSLFRRNAYVGYTATPYANIFIDRTDEKDLFPRHFIVNLPTPPAYLSPKVGLSKEEQQGLYGELRFLKKCLTSTSQLYYDIVQSYVGTNRTMRDFQGKNWAVEVKTTSTNNPQVLIINGERQLDDTLVDNLYLYHCSVEVSKQAGESLPEMVHNIREILKDDVAACSLFNAKLFEAGYLDIHEPFYLKRYYKLRKDSFFCVKDKFPRIRENELRDGVGNVNYSISISSFYSYEVPEQQVFLKCLSND